MPPAAETLPRFNIQPPLQPAEAIPQLLPQNQPPQAEALPFPEAQPGAVVRQAATMGEADTRAAEMHADHPEGCQCHTHHTEADQLAESLFGGSSQENHEMHSHHDGHEHGHVCNAACKHNHSEADDLAQSLFGSQHAEATNHHREACACAHCKAHHSEADDFAASLFGEAPSIPTGEYARQEKDTHAHHQAIINEAVNPPASSEIPASKPTHQESRPVIIPQEVSTDTEPAAIIPITETSFTESTMSETQPTGSVIPEAAVETSDDPDTITPLSSVEVPESEETFGPDAEKLPGLRLANAEAAVMTADAKPAEPIAIEAKIMTLAQETILQAAPELAPAAPLVAATAEVLLTREAPELTAINDTVTALVDLTEAWHKNELVNTVVLNETLAKLSEQLNVAYPDLLGLLEVKPETGVLNLRTLEILHALQQLTHEEFRKEFISSPSLSYAADEDQAGTFAKTLGAIILRLFNQLGQRRTAEAAIAPGMSMISPAVHRIHNLMAA